MKTHLIHQLGLVGLASASLTCTPAHFQKILSKNNLKGTINSAYHIKENGTFAVTGNLAYPTSPTGLPALCAVEANMTTEVGTSYTFGIFLPDDWNDRFLAVGNGGYAGGINYIDMGAGVGYGFATMSTDTGHNSSYQGTSWAYHNEESIADWGWRAMHESTVTSKVLVNGFYGEDSRYNYFSGCSVGGRQGLRALQLFPDDYDGVSAGAPAWWTTHNQLFALKVLLWNFPENSTQTIPESLFSVIGDEVLKQCDPQDGLTDNIISDPFGCNFDPLPLLCTANKTTDCLTSEQIDTTFKVYNDWVDVNQTFVFPHYLFGTESSWSSAIGTGAMSSVENQEGFAQDLLQFGPNWSYKDLTYKTVEYADRLNPGNATASEFDIRPFKARGGKLIHYQGYADPTLPTGSSIYFYEHVSRALTEKSATLDDFYRMFLIPGMEHCMSTPSTMNAPWYIAGANQAAELGDNVSGVPGYRDSKHDVILALMNWVENGTAPDSIIATKYTDDTTHEKVERQRPICPYPQQAKYQSGNPDMPRSWKCESLY